MAYERLPSQSYEDALNAYERGAALLASFHIPKPPPSQPGKINYESFSGYRELWRWSERLKNLRCSVFWVQVYVCYCDGPLPVRLLLRFLPLCGLCERFAV